MRILFFIVMVQFVFIDGIAQTTGEATVTVDVTRSKLEWTGRKLGGEHYGEIQLSSGRLAFKKGRLAGGSFEIDMTSITCTDLTDEKSNRRLVDHLKSEDFFSVTRFPKATLVMKKVGMKSPNEYSITADLTIKGKTNEIEFPAFLKGQSEAEANVVFDRSKFDVKFGSQSFFENLGDKLVYDDIELKITLILLPPDAP